MKGYQQAAMLDIDWYFQNTVHDLELFNNFGVARIILCFLFIADREAMDKPATSYIRY
jgi:hypothetical protein